jgi:hypothetical protein
MISATAFKIDSGGQNIPLIVMKNNRWKAWQGKLKYSYPSAILSITNPTWHNTGSNPDFRSVKQATNCQSYGMVYLH